MPTIANGTSCRLTADGRAGVVVGTDQWPPESPLTYRLMLWDRDGGGQLVTGKSESEFTTGDASSPDVTALQDEVEQLNDDHAALAARVTALENPTP